MWKGCGRWRWSSCWSTTRGRRCGRGGGIGVDVFFVISGFVVTLQLMREVERTGRVDVVAFWSRRVRRVLPAATLVLGGTLLAAHLGATRLRWGSICHDVIGAPLYVVNWLFAARSVAHPGEETGPSAVQHYWSLAVGLQAGLLWPLFVLGMVLVAAWLRRRSGTRPDPRRATRLVLAVLALGLVLLVVLPSLAWSWWYTAAEPEAAHFVTTTRLWELGLGAGVAVLSPAWSMVPRAVAVALGWAGLVALVAAGSVLDPTVPWPGTAALWPALATVLVIVAGFGAGPSGPVRLLGRPPGLGRWSVVLVCTCGTGHCCRWCSGGWVRSLPRRAWRWWRSRWCRPGWGISGWSAPCDTRPQSTPRRG
ncbi:MAG: acyltransferase family protein [Ornithinimicrobium sp.]|uniref:acyltransferase family protein n=1 Tax=Ornithinimicrobium sp. TaxID=1977084 RepID=UPI003D9B88E8